MKLVSITLTIILSLTLISQVYSACDPECQNGATCLEGNSCLCTQGWSGFRCQWPVCDSNPGGCGAGRCVAPNVCNCTGTGWTGEFCQTPVCEPECLNGGVCVNPNGCDCTNTGFIGELCQIPICEPPCENGGACMPGNQCNCTGIDGWEGERCELGICERECLNGGRCSGPDVCDCAGTGWAGERCEVEVNECILPNTQPCHPLTSCINLPGTYNCTACPSGYTGSGKMTEGGCVDIDECAEGRCDPLTNCTNTPGSFSCGPCPTGYSGTGLTECTVSCTPRCQNGGNCTAPNTCTCPSGFNGTACELDINECASDVPPCGAFSTCTNTRGSFTCACVNGYEGDPYSSQGCVARISPNRPDEVSSANRIELAILTSTLLCIFLAYRYLF